MILRRAAAVALAWALLWAYGYNPADYPVRLAVRAFGRTAEAVYEGSRYEGPGLVSLRFKSAAGAILTDTTSHRASYGASSAPGWNRLMRLDVAGMTAYRVGAGLPFSTFDYLVTLALAFFLTRLSVPGFLGWGPGRPGTDAVRLPLTVLKTADFALAACAVLGPILYSAPQIWMTGAVWFGLRLARLRGHVEFIQILPPADAPPQLALPPSEGAAIRRAKDPIRNAASFWALTTPEGWPLLPAGALATGLLILALVGGHHALISVPVPGYRLLGIPLGGWSAVGWSLSVFAAAALIREFLAAWRRSAD